MKLHPIEIGFRFAFPEKPTLPAITDMVRCFFPLDTLIAQLRADEIDMAGPVPVMLNNDGSYGQITPSLEAWCATFERMARAMRIDLDLGHMRRLAKRIETGILIDVADIDRFEALVERCRSVYFACPNAIRNRAYMDECIEIELTELGLRAAA